MTNDELDLWLATEVMYAEVDEDSPIFGLIVRYERDGESFVTEWAPTTFLPQAIEVAERARKEGRLGWYELHSPCGKGPEWDVVTDFEVGSASAESPAEAVCRALYAVLSREV